MNSMIKLIIAAIVVFLLIAAVVKYRDNEKSEANPPIDSALTNPDPEEDNDSKTPADPNTELDSSLIFKG